VEINETLVDAHLEAIPGLGSLSAGSLAGRDAEDLSRHAHGALDLQLLVLSTTDKICADCKKQLIIN